MDAALLAHILPNLQSWEHGVHFTGMSTLAQATVLQAASLPTVRCHLPDQCAAPETFFGSPSC